MVIASGCQPTSTTCLWASIISPWSKITPYNINNLIFGTIWRILTFSISWRSFTSEKSNRGSILWFTDRTYSRFDLRNITNYEYRISLEYSKWSVPNAGKWFFHLLTSKSLFACFASVSTRAKAFKSIFVEVDITFSSVFTWIRFTVINLKINGNDKWFHLINAFWI